MTLASGMDAFLHPNSVAILGASDDPRRVGGMPLRYLREVGFAGQVFPINSQRDTVQGETAFPSITSVGQPVDLAIIAVPAEAVIAAVEECAERRVRAAIVFTSGFAETDATGEKRQQQLAEVVQRSRMRVCGPNCAGIMSVPHHLTACFGSHLAGDSSLPPGPMSVVGQSGAIGAYLFTLARHRGYGLTHWVTTGNEVDTTVADFVEAIALDEETAVIALYLEQVRQAETLMRACSVAHARGKRLVGVLAGRSEAAKGALQSHTAALAGDREVAVAALREFGIELVDSIEDLLSAAIALARTKQPSTDGLGIITVSGGAGIMTVDRASQRGLSIPTLTMPAQDRMKALLPYAGTANPVDVTGNISNRPEIFRPFLDELVHDDRIGGIVCFLGHVLLSPHVGRRLRSDLIAVAGATDKPIWLVGVVGERQEATELEAAGIGLVEDPGRAVDLHAIMVHARRASGVPILERRNSAKVEMPTPVSVHPLSEITAQEVLRPVGVLFPNQVVATSRDEAVEAARHLSSAAVVMKIVSPDIQHKSDIGGVRVGVARDQVAAVYDEIISAAQTHVPRATVEGVVVQELVEGHPAIVGTKYDPHFGPVVLVGSGGIYTELIRDRAIALAPVDRLDADRLIDRTSLSAFLAGARRGRALARNALVDLVVTVSQRAWEARAHIAAIELNPVLVSEHRAVATDAVIELHDPV